VKSKIRSYLSGGWLIACGRLLHGKQNTSEQVVGESFLGTQIFFGGGR
jgi:hypothetical protein